MPTLSEIETAIGQLLALGMNDAANALRAATKTMRLDAPPSPSTYREDDLPSVGEMHDKFAAEQRTRWHMSRGDA